MLCVASSGFSVNSSSHPFGLQVGSRRRKKRDKFIHLMCLFGQFTYEYMTHHHHHHDCRRHRLECPKILFLVIKRSTFFTILNISFSSFNSAFLASLARVDDENFPRLSYFTVSSQRWMFVFQMECIKRDLTVNTSFVDEIYL